MLANAILTLGSPLRLIRRQLPHLEHRLQLTLDREDLESVIEGCTRCSVRIGSFYHWYLQKLLIARELRRMDGRKILERLRSLDKSRYELLTKVHATAANRGLLVAIPHHGHYVLSIVG